MLPAKVGNPGARWRNPFHSRASESSDNARRSRRAIRNGCRWRSHQATSPPPPFGRSPPRARGEESLRPSPRCGAEVHPDEIKAVRRGDQAAAARRRPRTPPWSPPPQRLRRRLDQGAHHPGAPGDAENRPRARLEENFVAFAPDVEPVECGSANSAWHCESRKVEKSRRPIEHARRRVHRLGVEARLDAPGGLAAWPCVEVALASKSSPWG